MSIDRRVSQGPLQVRALWDESKTARLAENVLAVRRRRFITRVATTAVVMGGLVLVFGLKWQGEGPGAAPQAQIPSVSASGLRSPNEHSPEGLSAGADEQEERLVRFGDGSRIEFEEGAELTVDERKPSVISTSLNHGSASFSVVPDDERRFEVHAGKLLIRTFGTAFHVQQDKEQTHIQVDQGRVQVSWPGGARELVANERGTFPHASLSGEEEVANGVSQKSEPSADLAPDWRKLAKTREYQDAYRVMNKTPNAVKKTAADLMLAADVARLSGHPSRAAALLNQVESEFAGDPRAPLAAFTRGRLLLENLSNPAAAAEAFARSRTLSRGGSLAADALVREMKARLAAGQHPKARSLARLYLKSYPEGRHRAQCERIASTP